ncbi:3-keto-5-aminohexanoate cleavage protein [Chelativorans sp. M5D2P16]|uniref:3-keto-5-aminohexanoate cleavage protein n=1 Tax=Chelativorans sp. M5D2P16 TaxID=3095678 RepID=UPI002ACA5AAA|nr:3-keto-5-aminohexanoate cleavage protein [Chelativorans sp. M5D2P16]MDZ5697708.1 3-keto-5-aminohexanoate cleavage protein [Chelativorans sp. M5D2P16]
MADKIILTCALTGSIHTPTMSPHLPVTADEMVEQALGAAEAGAAVLHVHARDPETGRPSARVDDFMGFLPRIKQSSDAVINISTGGSSQMTLEERLSPSLAAKPEMCSLNMGSMNFGIFPLAGRYETWKHEWEKGFLEATRDVVFKNTFADIETILSDLGEGCGTRFEFECYDAGHIQTVAYFLKKGLIRPPIFIQFVLGILGGIDASPESLLFMKSTADRLLGDAYRFSVLAAGRHQMRLGTMGAVLGGNARVGLEDSLTNGAGRALAPDNAHQVARIRRILEEMGFAIATPEEARAMLDLKGADRVAF